MLVNTVDPPIINGIVPQEGSKLFKYHYMNLNLQTNFTGKVLLAKDFIESMYVHMGFAPGYKYREVFELKFKHGHLVSTKDCTRKMSEYRKRKAGQPLGPGPSASRRERLEWVREAFDLDFDIE